MKVIYTQQILRRDLTNFDRRYRWWPEALGGVPGTSGPAQPPAPRQ
jgi:hypothetical protein